MTIDVAARHALSLSLLCAVSAMAQTPPDIQACLGIDEDAERLACYDKQAGRKAMVALPASPASPAAADPQASPASRPGQPGKAQADVQPSDSFTSRYWELASADKRGTFNYTSYRPNYFLPLRGMRSLNRQPHSPTRGTATDLPRYQRGETKIQLSLRSKVLEDALLPGADLWVAYTQQSMWQLWNSSESAPFRNTDFQPEVMYVVPTPEAWQGLPAGWRWRMTQAGLVHQSNGQPGVLSRSWNRIYGAVGVERGDVTASLRLEQRLEVDDDQRDDNPDIVDHLGRVEAQVTWAPGLSTTTLRWRPSFTGKGLVQLDWTYPVYKDRPDGLRWYFQAFHGFGETLLDYNFRQSSLGLGLTIFKF